MITESFFKSATGREPENDDLERCNCQKAGEEGHWFCGWNHDTNLPAFYVGLEYDKIMSGYYKVKLE